MLAKIVVAVAFVLTVASCAPISNETNPDPFATATDPYPAPSKFNPEKTRTVLEERLEDAGFTRLSEPLTKPPYYRAWIGDCEVRILDMTDDEGA